MGYNLRLTFFIIPRGKLIILIRENSVNLLHLLDCQNEY